MAISIPGLSLSILRQQTAVQAGLPLLISGRFTAFGMGVPTFIRVFLEGPSYDPKLRSFDTFASPFSGDYSVNVLAEKDGQYTVYAQAFPPPLIPTGPPFPEAMMLLPPFAESTRPPLVVGYPFNGGVDALLPDGTRQRLTAPPMQPIEFRPIITVAPGITVTAPGVPAAYPGIPAYPPAVPPAPPPAVPPVEVITRAAVDDIRFSPEEINPGMEATGVMSWRNTGDEVQLFDTVFYLVSPVGARYGPLQVNQNVWANPQVPNTQNLRLGTAGMPSGIYAVVAEIYDSTTGVLLTAMPLPSRLSIREIAPPVVPVPPPPVVPEVPMRDILGTPSLNLPSQINVGDVWYGSVSLPTFGTTPVFAEAQLMLRDPQGYEHTVSRPGGRTLQIGETLQIPVNFDTTGFTGGYYNILLRVFDQFGQQVAEFPMGFLSMIEALAPPLPTVPTVPKTIQEIADEVNIELGGSYVAGVLTPPAWWTGSVTDWSRHVQAIAWERYYLQVPVVPEVPTVPLIPTPEVPTAPTLPTADMFATPSVYLPTEVEIGQLWSGNISIPTQVPFALQALPSLPSYPLNARLQLQSPIGQLFDVGTYSPAFVPGQPINLPVNFDTRVLPQEGMHNLILNISDLQGNPLFSNVIGSLQALMPFAPPEIPIPGIPEIPVPEAPVGSIVKMELEYNESRGTIPASVPQGERGLVHIWGRNDMPSRQRLGIGWIVRDPDGYLVEDYKDWAFMRTSTNNTHEFISSRRFDLSKGGTYTLAVSLFFEGFPIEAARWDGSLCTVTPFGPPPPPEAPPAEYTLEVAIEPPGAGRVTISPIKATYSPGERVTLTATPYFGYEFDHWGGWPPFPGVGSTALSIQITMDDDKFAVAAFREAVALPPAAVLSLQEIALQVNEELGGSYVAGVLTPPAWWTGSVTEWSRHVQAIAWERYLAQGT